MIAGTLELQLQADVARLRQDLAQAKNIVTSAANQMELALEGVKGMLQGLFAGMSVAAVAAFTKQAIDLADSMDDLSKSTGLAVEQLAGLRYAAKIGGTQLEEATKSVNKLQLEMGKAPEKFAKVGITARDGMGALKQLADLFVSIEDPQLRAAVAAETLGKGWSTMAPLLSRGSDEIEKLVQRGQDLAGITQANSDISGDFNDALDEMLIALQGTSLQMAQGFLPMLTELVRDLTRLSMEARNGGDAFGLLGGALKWLIVIAGNVAFTLRGIGTEIGGIAAQAKALWTEGFAGFETAANIRKEMIDDAEKGRKAFDEWQAKMLAFGQATQAAARDQETLKMASKAQAEAAAQDAKALAARMKALREFVGGGGKGEADEVQKMAKAGAELANSLLALDAGLSGDFAKKWEQLNAAYRAGHIGVEKLVQAQAELLAQQPLMKAQVKAAQDAAQERQRLRNAEYEQARALLQQEEEQKRAAVKSVEQQIEAIQFETAALTMTNTERAKAIALRQIESSGIKKSAEEYRQLADDISRAVEQREATREALSMWDSIDRTAHDVWTNIWDGGSNVFKKLGQVLKASLLDLLYQMTVKRWIISIGASMGLPGAALASSAMGGASGLSALGGLGSLGSISGGLMNGLSAWGSGGSVLGVLSNPGLYTGMELLGTALPVVGVIAAVAALASKFKGETRSGGQYSFGNLISGPSGGELGVGSTSAGATAKITADSIDAMLAAIGSSSRLSNFMSGLETSEKGKGFAYAGGTLTTGGAFGQGWGAAFAQDGWMNRRGSMTPEQAVAAFGEELKQATLQALAAATDVPAAISRIIAGKDFDAMAAEELDATLAAVQAVITEVQQFDQALAGLPFEHLIDRTFDLKSALIEAVGGVDALASKLAFVSQAYYTEAEQRQQLAINIQRALAAAGAEFTVEQILGSSRGQFRQMLDVWGSRADGPGQAIFAALLNVAQAFDQLHPVVQDTTVALVDATNAHEEYLRSLGSAGETIWRYVRELGITRAGTASPATLLANTRAAYLADLGGARAGDVSASQRIADSARAYIEAQKGYTASGTMTQAVISQVLAELSSLPATQTYEQQMLAAAQTQIAILNAINASAAATVAAVNVNTQVTATGGAGGASWGGSPTAVSGSSWSSMLMGIDWSNGTAGTAQLAGYMQSYGKTIEDVAAVYSWFTTQQLADHMKMYGYASLVPGYAEGGMHGGGLRIVGERGWELEATGPARYWSHDQTRSMMRGGDTGGLREEIAALRAVVVEYAQRDLANGDAIAGAMQAQARAERNKAAQPARTKATA